MLQEPWAATTTAGQLKVGHGEKLLYKLKPVSRETRHCWLGAACFYHVLWG